MNIETIAKVCHEINRAYCQSMGDGSHPAWEEASEAQKSSIRAGVQMHLDNPAVTPEEAHASWLAQKDAEGWTYGPAKNLEKKEHPCLVPYGELPKEQRVKDWLFRAVVRSLAQEA